MKTQDVLIAHPKTDEQLDALKAFMKALKIEFEISGVENYNPDFVEKILESREQYKKGDFINVEKKDIKSFLEL